MKKFLLFVSLTGIAAVVGAVVVGVMVFDGTVVDKPYERGIAWDAERERRETSGLKVSIVPAPFRKGTNEIIVRLLDAKGIPVSGESITLLVSRTTSPDHDGSYAAAGREDGAYLAAIDLPERGRWKIVVAVARGTVPLEFPFEIFAGD